MKIQLIDKQDMVMGDVDIEGTSWLVSKDRFVNATAITVYVKRPGTPYTLRFTTSDGIPLNKGEAMTIGGEHREIAMVAGAGLCVSPGKLEFGLYTRDPKTGIKLT